MILYSQIPRCDSDPSEIWRFSVMWGIWLFSAQTPEHFDVLRAAGNKYPGNIPKKIMLLISKHNTASTDSVLRVNWESVSKPQKTPLVIFFCEVLQDRISVKTKEHMLRCKERNPLCGELGKSWYLFKQVLWFKTQYYLSEVILNKSGLTDRTELLFLLFSLSVHPIGNN